jgi:hypothetical protein
MAMSRLRLSLIFWLLAPAALARRLRRRRAGWIEAAARPAVTPAARER